MIVFSVSVLGRSRVVVRTRVFGLWYQLAGGFGARGPAGPRHGRKGPRETQCSRSEHVVSSIYICMYIYIRIYIYVCVGSGHHP